MAASSLRFSHANEDGSQTSDRLRRELSQSSLNPTFDIRCKAAWASFNQHLPKLQANAIERALSAVSDRVKLSYKGSTVRRLQKLAPWFKYDDRGSGIGTKIYKNS